MALQSIAVGSPAGRCRGAAASPRRSLRSAAGLALTLLAVAAPATGELQGDPVDVSGDFQSPESTYFVAGEVVRFDPASGAGTLRWLRHERRAALSFNKLDSGFVRAEANEFPGSEYDRDPELPFELTFPAPRTVRIRISARPEPIRERDSPMLVASPAVVAGWRVVEAGDPIVFASDAGRVVLHRDPWRLSFYDAAGRLLTRTRGLDDPPTFSTPIPFSFVRRARDLGRTTAASFDLAHDERLFGGGESFTRLDKRGQKLVLYLRDAMGAQSRRMYKPIPFFFSSRGYGMFLHTSAPTTFDFGSAFDSANVLYSGDELLDLFVFLGSPKEVLEEYTALTGRAPVPPLWSFGLWMSRITYKSEAEVREVTAELRRRRIPSDVIHLDTGWFETDWQCDFRFSPSRFPDPEGMIADLRDQGFRVSLWQLPYFTRKNPLFEEAARRGFFVRDEGGERPHEDGILDMTHPEARRWYQGLLGRLLEMGVGAIKVDFGEDAPLRGLYASGRTGWYEHNLYPLRYNRLVAELTEKIRGERIIWARSAWAGSQRYPLHWSGDAENSDSAMAATLRAGLSLGLSGFTYWSHDAGGFVRRAPRGLYRRWLAFAALSSHTRCHGAPPREPWEYDEEFTDDFRRIMELRYRLLPYLWAQAKASSERGHPLLRPLFLEFPDDPTSWLVEDQYLLGADLLVAPLFDESGSRPVYLPPGGWIDYQTGRKYPGAAWHQIAAGELPVLILVRAGAALPHAGLAQSTGEIDWSRLELRVFSPPGREVRAAVALPEGPVQELRLAPDSSGGWTVEGGPEPGRVEWTVRHGGD